AICPEAHAAAGSVATHPRAPSEVNPLAHRLAGTPAGSQCPSSASASPGAHASVATSPSVAASVGASVPEASVSLPASPPDEPHADVAASANAIISAARAPISDDGIAERPGASAAALAEPTYWMVGSIR